jgi:hypothetical protein
MSLQYWFWGIYVIALLFGLWSNYATADPLWTRRAGAYTILWLLVGILGWATFGSVVKN